MRKVTLGLMRSTTLLAATLAGMTLPGGANAQMLPAIRPVSELLHTSSERFGEVSGIRLLSNGQLLVNDMLNGRLLILDSTLTMVAIVADSAPRSGRQYPRQPTGIIPFTGDSTLFVYAATQSIPVVDGRGHFGRDMGWPQLSETRLVLGGPSGLPGFDQSGRLVYRGETPFRLSAPPMSASSDRGSAGRAMDSTALLRVDFRTRRVDTAAFLRFYREESFFTKEENGTSTITFALDPLPAVDDWAVLPGGSIAIVRAQDYHIDWISSHGEQSTAKIAHEWRFLSDSAKSAIVDSARAATLKRIGLASRLRTTTSVVDPSLGAVYATGSSGETHWAVTKAKGAVTLPRNARTALSDSARRARYQKFIDPSELPDYAPAFIHGGVLAGGDGNLWVRSTLSAPGGPVYDVIGPSGRLIRRVNIPLGRVISAVGNDGTAYLAYRNADGVRLETRRVGP